MTVILASGSAARQSILTDFGVAFEISPADIDERAIIKQSLSNDLSIAEITQNLAAAKAFHISKKAPDALVIGSDQTLDFNGQILNKAKTHDEAAEKLKALRGQTHILRSAVCVVRHSRVIFSDIANAHLTMHDFNDEFLADYMTHDPDALTSCVGGYKIEGQGAALFSSVAGDQHTIMGMPSKQLIAFLRETGSISP